MYLVALKMQHYPFTYIWFGIVGLLFLSAVRELMKSKFTDVTMFLWTSGLVVYGQILARFGFNICAKEAIKRLEELLSGEIPAAF